MIDNEATYQFFGYYSYDLSCASSKKIVAVCDECKGIRFLSKQSYHALCRSCTRRKQFETREGRMKAGNANRGKTFSNEWRQAMRDGHKARKKRIDDEKELKISRNRRNPYHSSFTEKFKDGIRDKFGRKCFLCKGKYLLSRELSVHHIDYNKKHKCDIETDQNCIPLCDICHPKTNVNRDFWQKYLEREVKIWNENKRIFGCPQN